ncbi:outer envelope pore protein 37, chloroplastic isoform X2 [Canna indica]|uniref:Outer envelope pore protein 37, chloroplastic isoform X2 n=1 Tax=Canna indica TaxID=4628 RepID=A0AAQ3K3N9_9LILI|nr:outer envelope pore protein 37, chloroplastic isoform X2 [Canna indica]
MADSAPPNPNPKFPPFPLSLPLPPPPPLSPPSPPPPPSPTCHDGAAVPVDGPGRCFFSSRRPPVRVTSEFDSDSSVFFHKVSCKIFDSLAKLKVSFQNDRNGKIAYPQLGFITKHFSALYDIESRNALLKGSFDVGDVLQVRATHDVKEQQGEVTMIASLLNPSYKLEVSSLVPSVCPPRATVRFPLGEVSVEERKDLEAEKVLSINGILKGQLLNGVCTASYKDEDLNLRYSYKDEEMSFIPSISLPSNAVSLAFKRRFSPADKLSYWYHFDSSQWSMVYKHTVGKDLKFKAGYDSEVRLGWASLWVGDEDGKAKTAPMKTKVQFMLQVPQDGISQSVLMFRVKKRWDF